MASALLRGDDNRVGFAELFYDLVYVFGITQVSHLLLHHYSPLGALESALLFLELWWAWIYSTWLLNRLDPETAAVRGLLFALMAAGLFLAMSIPAAFGARGLAFALALVATHAIRALFAIFAAKDAPELRRTQIRIGVWMAASGLFWIAGGLAGGEARILLWLAALGIEYLGPVMAFAIPGFGRDTTADWTVRGGHMAERCALFVIICLGETLLVSGATFGDMDWDGVGTAAFLTSLGCTLAMWWIYFHIGHKRGAHQIEGSADPGRIARLAYTYAHIPIVAGIVLSAVGSERVIAHPHGHGSWGEAASVVGGAILFLAGNGAFKSVSGRWFPLSHLVGLGLAVLVFLAAPWMDLLMLSLATMAVLILVAVWEHLSLKGGHATP